MDLAAVEAVVRLGSAFLLIWLAALVFAIYVIVDMARRPRWQWQQAGSNKVLWLVLEIVFVLGFLSVLIGIIYLASIRPRLVAAERQGPPMYGSWLPGGWPQAGGWPPAQAPGATWPPQSGPAPGGPPQAYPPATSAPPPYPYPGTEAPPAYPAAGGVAPAASAPVETSRPLFGWYPDPSGNHELRYWDGTTWTEHVSDHGEQSTDALPG